MFGGMNQLFYPMSADIYYATQTQNDFGEIVRAWTKDREISCSAIKQNPNSRTPNFAQTDINLEYDIGINFRTNQDIQISSSSNTYKITDILIKNIKDGSGNVVWKEDANNPTIFEVRSVEPMLDVSSTTMGYRVLCVRADNQEI
jgi:hypothetical protein